MFLAGVENKNMHNLKRRDCVETEKNSHLLHNVYCMLFFYLRVMLTVKY